MTSRGGGHYSGFHPVLTDYNRIIKQATNLGVIMTAITSLLVRKSTKQSWNQASKVDLTDSRESLEEKLDALNEGSGFAKYKLGETTEVEKLAIEQSTAFEFTPEAETRLSDALDAVGGAPVELEDN